MISAGKVDISVQALEHRCVAKVEVNRPRHLHSFFAGKSVDYMLQSVPLVFSICGGAQSVVALRAAERALGLAVDPRIEQQRDRMVSLETLHEHLWSLLMDLPPALGFPRWQEAMALASQSLHKTMNELRSKLCKLNPHPQNYDFPPAEAFHNISTLLFGNQQADISADPPEQFEGVAGELLSALHNIDFQHPLPVAPADPELVTRHAGGSADQQEVDSANPRGSYQSGRPPSSNVTGLFSLLASADVVFALEELLRHQLSSGASCDSGPLARQCEHPWVRRHSGHALASRLLALLAETYQLLAGKVLAGGTVSSAGPDSGSAELETARGRLACALVVDKPESAELPATVKHMQVIAPTDWHFHPQGIAAKLLSEVPPEPELLPERAEVLVKLINPCIGYCLHICGDDNIGEMLARDGRRGAELVDPDHMKEEDVNGYA